MKKVTGRLTAGMFAKYEDSVGHLVSNDQSLLFMNQIKGIPAYWKKLKRCFSNGKTIKVPNIFIDVILC